MKKGLFLVILAGISWGTSCIFVNLLSPYGFDSRQMTATRLTTALIGLLIYCLLFRRTAWKLKPKELCLCALCGLCLFGTSSFYFEAMQLTSASTSVVLMYLAPVPVMLCSILFFGEGFHAKKGIAVVGMLLGCILVAGVLGDFRPNPLGIVMGLLSAFAYAGYNIFTKLSTRRGMDPIATTLYTFLFATLCALALCKPWELPTLTAQRPGVLLPLFFVHGLVTCLLPYLCYSFSLKFISVGVASAMSIVEPLSGALLGILIYKDPLTLPTAMGMILILSSVFLLGMGESTEQKKHR